MPDRGGPSESARRESARRIPPRARRFLIGCAVVAAVLIACELWTTGPEPAVGAGAEAPSPVIRAGAAPGNAALEPNGVPASPPAARPGFAAATTSVARSREGAAQEPSAPVSSHGFAAAAPAGGTPREAAGAPKNASRESKAEAVPRVARDPGEGPGDPASQELPHPPQAGGAGSGNPADHRTDPSFIQLRERDEQLLGRPAASEIEDLYGRGLADIDRDAGREQLRSIIDRYPYSNRAACAAVQLAWAYLDEGRWAEVVALLAGLVSPGTDAVFRDGGLVLPAALLAYGDALAAQGDLAAASAAWQRVLAEFPDRRDASGTTYATLARRRLGS